MRAGGLRTEVVSMSQRMTPTERNSAPGVANKKATSTFFVAAAVGQSALRTRCKIFAAGTRSNDFQLARFLLSPGMFHQADRRAKVRGADPSEGNRHPSER